MTETIFINGTVTALVILGAGAVIDRFYSKIKRVKK